MFQRVIEGIRAQSCVFLLARFHLYEKREGWEEDGQSKRLAPDDSFLVQEIINDLNTVAHLSLRLLRHGKHSADQLARFHVF